ncbi:MAG: NAD-dependent epimerase/dehydratase family protein [Flavobacteriales bacterium]
MAKVLVSGATGMVGAHVCLRLSRAGHQVVAMRRSSSEVTWMERIFAFNQLNMQEHVVFCEADLLDISSLQEALKDIDVVVHCAAKVSFFPADNEALFLHNHQGTANLVNVCLDFPRIHFIHISSVAALGNPEQEMINEQTRWKSYPYASPYSITKYMAEMEVWRGGEEGLKINILQPSYILGQGNWYTGSASLFRQVKKGLNYYTTATMGFVYVRDVAEAVLSCIEKKKFGESYIINAENKTYREILLAIAQFGNLPQPAKQLNRKTLRFILPALKLIFWLRGKRLPLNKFVMASIFQSKFYDNKKSRDELGINYTPIDDCIKDSWAFFKHYFPN